MSVDKKLNLFGSKQRTDVLILLRLLEQSYPSELADLLEAPVFSVQKIVEALESDGIIISHKVGRTRLLTFNSRFIASKELDALLWKLGKGNTRLQKIAARKRRRPRRKGKPG